MSMADIPILETERLQITLYQPEHAEALLSYYTDNRDFLAPWGPQRDEAFYSLEHFQTMAEFSVEGFEAATTYRFIALERESGELVACCNANNVVWGAFEACHLGFSIAEHHQGCGLMEEAVRAVLSYLETEVGLHRVMANHLPHNERSAKLLGKLGFEREGYAKRYLKIDGCWQDHVLTALVFSDSD